MHDAILGLACIVASIVTILTGMYKANPVLVIVAVALAWIGNRCLESGVKKLRKQLDEERRKGGPR